MGTPKVVAASSIVIAVTLQEYEDICDGLENLRDDLYTSSKGGYAESEEENQRNEEQHQRIKDMLYRWQA